MNFQHPKTGHWALLSLLLLALLIVGKSLWIMHSPIVLVSDSVKYQAASIFHWNHEKGIAFCDDESIIEKTLDATHPPLGFAIYGFLLSGQPYESQSKILLAFNGFLLFLLFLVLLALGKASGDTGVGAFSFFVLLCFPCTSYILTFSSPELLLCTLFGFFLIIYISSKDLKNIWKPALLIALVVAGTMIRIEFLFLVGITAGVVIAFRFVVRKSEIGWSFSLIWQTFFSPEFVYSVLMVLCGGGALLYWQAHCDLGGFSVKPNFATGVLKSIGSLFLVIGPVGFWALLVKTKGAFDKNELLSWLIVLLPLSVFVAILIPDPEWNPQYLVLVLPLLALGTGRCITRFENFKKSTFAIIIAVTLCGIVFALTDAKLIDYAANTEKKGQRFSLGTYVEDYRFQQIIQGSMIANEPNKQLILDKSLSAIDTSYSFEAIYSQIDFLPFKDQFDFAHIRFKRPNIKKESCIAFYLQYYGDEWVNRTVKEAWGYSEKSRFDLRYLLFDTSDGFISGQVRTIILACKMQ